MQHTPDSREPGGCSTWLEADSAGNGGCGVLRPPDLPRFGLRKSHHGPDPAGSHGRCTMNLVERSCPISRDPLPKRQDAPIPNPLAVVLTAASNSGWLREIGALRLNRPDRSRSQVPVQRGNWNRNRLSDRVAVRRSSQPSPNGFEFTAQHRLKSKWHPPQQKPSQPRGPLPQKASVRDNSSSAQRRIILFGPKFQPLRKPDGNSN